MEWTDDLLLPLVPPKTVDELVDFIIDNRRKMGRLQILTTLAIRFGLTFEDARLALDRVGGGETRCDCDGGRKGRNRPDPIKDPIACASYDRRRGIPAPVLPPQGTSAWRRWLDVIRSGDVKRAAVGIRGRSDPNGANRCGDLGKSGAGDRQH